MENLAAWRVETDYSLSTRTQIKKFEYLQHTQQRHVRKRGRQNHSTQPLKIAIAQSTMSALNNGFNFALAPTENITCGVENRMQTSTLKPMPRKHCSKATRR